MHPRSFLLISFLFFTAFNLQHVASSNAQEEDLVKEWVLWPNNMLGQQAANYPGPFIEKPATAVIPLRISSLPMAFFGEEPTERVEDALDPALLPTEALTVELWLVDHVNQPLGAFVTARSKEALAKPGWLLGYYDNRIYATLNAASGGPYTIEKPVQRGWKSYWHHIVLTYDGERVQLYWNGDLVEDTAFENGAIQYPALTDVEMAAFMNHEPYMQLSDLVKHIRIYKTSLEEAAIERRFEQLQAYVNDGILFPDLFHFNAGPYLNMATETSINLLWETDRPATAIVEYGDRVPLENRITLDTPRRIQEVIMDGLEPQSSYFYRVVASADGEDIDSGVLSFQTAVNDGTPFSFAILGDTEARPHINSRLSQLIWGERPNFMLNVGDLTDGGMHDHKFEWNYEYFVGMTQLNSRIPVFPVPGNGEADLFWYSRYHVLPNSEAYYSFRYGNAEFFMLDSNQRRESFAPGGEQYEWLEDALSNSTATWKFVAHHHPTYTMEENDYGNAWEEPTTLGDLDVRQILPLYEALGVDMVFFGHIHGYERTMPINAGMVDIQNGVVHLLAGGGGGNLEDFGPTRSWFTRKVYRGHHYALVNIHDQQLRLTMYDTEGRLRDLMELRKDLPPSPNTVQIDVDSKMLTQPQQVTLATGADHVTIRYTLDGSIPKASSPEYTGPLTIDEPVLLTAASFNGLARISTSSRARFERPEAPALVTKQGLFNDGISIVFEPLDDAEATIRYTTNGAEPTAQSKAYRTPFTVRETTILKAKAFWPSGLASEVAEASFTRATYRSSEQVASILPGLRYAYYEGAWSMLPNFEALTAISEGIATTLDLFPVRQRDEHFGLLYTGYVDVPADGIYTFYLASDDGSKMYLGGELLIDNDGEHGVNEVAGEVALNAGLHPIRIEFFEHGGGESLSLSYAGPGISKQVVPATAYVHSPD